MADEDVIVEDEGNEGFEGNEDAACGKGCGLEPMGCSRCDEMGSSHPYAEFDDSRYW